MTYRSHSADGQQQVLVALNLDDQPLSASVPDARWTSEAGTGTRATGAVSVPPHDWGVWSRQGTKVPSPDSTSG